MLHRRLSLGSLVLTVLSWGLLAAGAPATVAAAPSSGAPSVRGNQLVDGSGQPLVLRGAMIETSLAYVHQWQQGKDPLAILNATTFGVMRQWGMNVVRINISAAMDQLPGYMSKLDSAVAAADAAGLYTVIDYHRDAQSASPAPEAILVQSDLDFWRFIAGRYHSDPHVLYDLVNEPKYASWSEWLNGTGADQSVGVPAAVQAIRSSGSQQVIVLEPGGAAGPHASGWQGFDPAQISDTQVMYSDHVYSAVITGNPATWRATWGAVFGTRPLYYGEWAALPQPGHPAQCRGLTWQNAAAVTNAFMDFMQAQGISYTAWSFTPSHMIVDTTAYTPTEFDNGTQWTCGSATVAGLGMGNTVKAYIAAHGAGRTFAGSDPAGAPAPGSALAAPSPSSSPAAASANGFPGVATPPAQASDSPWRRVLPAGLTIGLIAAACWALYRRGSGRSRLRSRSG